MTAGAEPLRMLAVYAHPDDEVFSWGATAAMAAERGVEVVLAVATGGEEGEIVNPEVRDSVRLEDLPEVRARELECSCDTLGIGNLLRLGYRDSGMAGSPSSQLPDAFTNQNLDEVARRIAGIMRRYRPHVVCTDEEAGGYGHPDHIMVNRATHLAFERAGDPTWRPEEGEPWQPLKLYWPVFAQDQIRRVRAGLAQHGIRFSFGVDLPGVDDEVDVGYPDDAVTTVVDVSSTIRRKVAAMRCYRTQVRPDFFYLRAPDDVVSTALTNEYFILKVSHVETSLPERDLFAGISQ